MPKKEHMDTTKSVKDKKRSGNHNGQGRDSAPSVSFPAQHTFTESRATGNSGPGNYNPKPKRAGHEHSVNRTNKRK